MPAAPVFTTAEMVRTTVLLDTKSFLCNAVVSPGVVTEPFSATMSDTRPCHRGLLVDSHHRNQDGGYGHRIVHAVVHGNRDIEVVPAFKALMVNTPAAALPPSPRSGHRALPRNRGSDSRRP